MPLSEIIRKQPLVMTNNDRRRELIESITDQYEICRETLAIGPHELEIIRPADPDAVLDEQTLNLPHAELEWQPYWAQAWDASIGISEHLCELNLSGREVLDLGCGLGITSAVALAQGASVFLGDSAPPALLFAEVNCWPWRDRATISIIDWRRSRIDRAFDWIIGSDILYDRNEIEPLNGFWRAHLKMTGRVLLGDPTRPMTREFLETIESLGWNVKQSIRKCEGIVRSIRIVELKAEKL